MRRESWSARSAYPRGFRWPGHGVSRRSTRRDESVAELRRAAGGQRIRGGRGTRLAILPDHSDRGGRVASPVSRQQPLARGAFRRRFALQPGARRRASMPTIPNRQGNRRPELRAHHFRPTNTPNNKFTPLPGPLRSFTSFPMAKSVRLVRLIAKIPRGRSTARSHTPTAIRTRLTSSSNARRITPALFGQRGYADFLFCRLHERRAPVALNFRGIEREGAAETPGFTRIRRRNIATGTAAARIGTRKLQPLNTTTTRNSCSTISSYDSPSLHAAVLFRQSGPRHDARF